MHEELQGIGDREVREGGGVREHVTSGIPTDSRTVFFHYNLVL
jgi:hypothetical protein